MDHLVARPAARGARLGGALTRMEREAAAPRVVVVGAGWSGIAAAIEASALGMAVTLVDAAPQAGGRARSQAVTLGPVEAALDNGQHLLIGAYTEVLRLRARIDAPRLDLERRRLDLHGPSGLRLRTPRLPAPLHLAVALARARGLGPGGRRAALRLVAGLRLSGWRVRDGETVAALMARTAQPTTLVAKLWEPLCTGALNTAPEAACAAAFAAVLRDSLGARRAASDLLLARAPLGALLPEPGIAWLQSRGARIRLRLPVTGVSREAGQWQVQSTTAGPIAAEHVVLAVPPPNAARLLEPLAAAPAATEALRATVATLRDGYAFDAISTVWLAWHATTVPSLPAIAMLDEDPARRWHGQWVFDRGVHAPPTPGGDPALAVPSGPSLRVAAVVVSARGRSADLDAEALAEGIAAQVAAQLRLPPPVHRRVITDKRATLRCVPERPRMHADSLVRADPACAGLWLAGDHCWPEYPATLESAARAGVAAARSAAGVAVGR